jgi:hypothetical protein
VLANVLDAVTTAAALSIGGRDLNPIVHARLTAYGAPGLLVLKGLELAALAAIPPALAILQRSMPRVTLGILAAALPAEDSYKVLLLV